MTPGVEEGLLGWKSVIQTSSIIGGQTTAYNLQKLELSWRPGRILGSALRLWDSRFDSLSVSGLVAVNGE